MKVSGDTARSILYGDEDGWKEVERKHIESTRWSQIYSGVFSKDGKFYKASWSEGSTECQDESPWEYEDEVEFVEVEQYDKVVKAWRSV